MLGEEGNFACRKLADGAAKKEGEKGQERGIWPAYILWGTLIFPPHVRLTRSYIFGSRASENEIPRECRPTTVPFVYPGGEEKKT